MCVSRRRLHTPPAVVVAFRLRGRELGEGLEQRHLARALPPHLDVVDVGGGEAERREVGLEQLAQLRRGDAALQPVEQHRHEASSLWARVRVRVQALRTGVWASGCDGMLWEPVPSAGSVHWACL